MSFLGTKKEFAPGIPSQRIKESPRIASPEIWRRAIQQHKTLRNNVHFDLRLVDEKSGKAYSWAVKNLPTNPGDKTLAVLQPTHTAEYSTWSGTIPKGTYGAGIVKLFSDDKTEILKADSDHVLFNVYKSNGDTERYALIRTNDDQYLFHNVTATRKTRPELPTSKPAYKSTSIDAIDVTDSNQILSPKIDGALNAFLFRKGKPIEAYSYRMSRKGTSKLIDHTYRLPHYKTLTPETLHGKTIVLGEVFAKDPTTNIVLPSTDTAARLLSNVWRSRELQKKAPLDTMIFNVLRYNGKDVSNKPYSEKLKILQTISKSVPGFKLPPMAKTPQQKVDMIRRIKSGDDLLTNEGVVVYNLNEPIPQKAKLVQDYDVFVRDIFPGKGKYTTTGAGGFRYSYTPEGNIIGRVGSGFTDQQRKDMHQNPSQYIGQLARVFSQEQLLKSKALRMPVFKDLRAEFYIKTKER